MSLLSIKMEKDHLIMCISFCDYILCERKISALEVEFASTILHSICLLKKLFW